MSHQCHQDLHACIIGFLQLCKTVLTDYSNVYITPGLVNSDIIENNFNQQRSTYNGANTNPNAVQYQNNMNSIMFGQNIVSRKSNAGSSLPTMPGCVALPRPLNKRKTCSSKEKYSKIKVIRL